MPARPTKIDKRPKNDGKNAGRAVHERITCRTENRGKPAWRDARAEGGDVESRPSRYSLRIAAVFGSRFLAFAGRSQRSIGGDPDLAAARPAPAEPCLLDKLYRQDTRV